MAHVIELCRSCGFEIPDDASSCPGCAPDGDVTPTLAALQAAGLALPTRSVHSLPTTRARRDVTREPVGSPVVTRTLLAVSSLFAVASALTLLLGWVVSLDRLVLEFPADTSGRLYDGALVLAWIAMGTLAGAVLGLATWCVRWARGRLARNQTTLLQH